MKVVLFVKPLMQPLLWKWLLTSRCPLMGALLVVGEANSAGRRSVWNLNCTTIGTHFRTCNRLCSGFCSADSRLALSYKERSKSIRLRWSSVTLDKSITAEGLSHRAECFLIWRPSLSYFSSHGGFDKPLLSTECRMETVPGVGPAAARLQGLATVCYDSFFGGDAARQCFWQFDL